METKVGVQGDEELYNVTMECISKMENLYWKNKHLTYDDYRDVCKRLVFVMTWQDSIENLRYVMKHVKPKAPDILFQKITPVIRKGRRDVYIISKDNAKFDEVFYSTLEELQEQSINH